MIQRVEKGTPNENAMRTMIAGIVAAILILIGVDPVARIYDAHFRQRPWIKAHVEIVPSHDDSPPVINYTVDAPAFVSGQWKAWTQAADTGRRLCGGDGVGTYGPQNSRKSSWEMQAFLEADCQVPRIPFQMCVSYTVQTARGVPGFFGPFCSDRYDPRREK